MLEQNTQRSKYMLQRQSLPESLAESLRERILNGEFKEGEQLVQEEIATDYGCSRMPVREAFRQLEAAGLIISRIHKGAIVSALPPEQIRELFELRSLLECDILKHSLGKLTAESIVQSEQILVQLENAYHTRDIARVGTLNWEFHRSLYLPAGKVQTLAILQGINVQIDRYIRIQLLLTSGFEGAEREHRRILSMCKKRDPAVVDFMRKHILSAGDNLVEALQKRRVSDAT
ncbi:GntR family transcriptional regulator [Mesorhizobium sp. 128a]